MAKTSPSFDCRKASTDVEKAICASEDLSFTDAALGPEFKRAKEAVAANPKLAADLKNSQLEWGNNRKFCLIYATHGETESCLDGYYSRRTDFLKRINANMTALPTGEAQPLSCSFFGSWQTHWNKSAAEDAKKLYVFISADTDNCWKQLAAKPDARSYYAKNYLQLTLESGNSCAEVSPRFDDFVFTQERMWSLGTDYLTERLTCHLPSDAQLTSKITKLADSLKVNAEEIYQKLKSSLAGSPQWEDINNAHNSLENVFKNGTPVQKLAEADIQKHNWAETLKHTQNLPHECSQESAADACVKLKIGPPKQLTTIQVHFKPSNDDQADITAIEIVDETTGKVRPIALPEDTQCSLIAEKWAVSAENCDGNGIRYLAIGHSTAKFPFWDKLSLDAKNAKLVKEKDDCASETQD